MTLGDNFPESVLWPSETTLNIELGDNVGIGIQSLQNLAI